GVVFVFPGQGSQWLEMGRALLQQSPAFATAVDECDAALRPHTGWSVSAVLRGDAGAPALQHVDVVQPALFAMAIGLAAAWRSLGLEPDAVVGHSQGEVPAAVIAGALSLEDGARVAATRSRLLRTVAGVGGMAVVELPVEAVEARLNALRSPLSVAVVNTATSTVVSGEDHAIDALLATLGSEGVFCRRVDVENAGHSAQMDALLPTLKAELSPLRPRASRIPMVSTVTGAVFEGQALDADYWCQNLRQPVRLDRALQTLLASRHGVFVEVSAHPVLAMPLTSACGDDAAVVGTLRRDEGDLSQLHHTLGVLHAHGYDVNWSALFSGGSAAPVALPTYAFQRQRYWLDSAPQAADLTAAGLSPAQHPLLGATTTLAEDDGQVFTGLLKLSDQAWLADHAVAGQVLVPGTAMLELALHAAQQLGLGSVQELTLEQPWLLARDAVAQLQLRVSAPEANGERRLELYGRVGEGAWARHASGLLRTSGESADDAGFAALRGWPP
ncbi:MAG TPA: acyltransferase domain-containing protein, partial [Polyangiales bacterium]